MENNKINNLIKNKHQKDYCFTLGEQTDNIDFDLNILNLEITLGCNYIYNIYNPTFYFAGSAMMLKELIDNHEFNKDTIYILSPFALISNCYNINNMTLWYDDIDVINNNTINSYTCKSYLGKLKNIINNNDNIYLLSNLQNFILTRNLDEIIDKDIIKKNLDYSYKYNNVIPLLIFKFIEIFKLKYIFIFGCDLSSYPLSTKDDLYFGLYTRYNNFENIHIINSSIEKNEKLDFIKSFDLIKIYNYYKINNLDITNLINNYVDYCKIEILRKVNKLEILNILLNNLDNIINFDIITTNTNNTNNNTNSDTNNTNSNTNNNNNNDNNNNINISENYNRINKIIKMNI